MGRILNTLVPLIILLPIVYVFRVPLIVFAYQGAQTFVPCRIPIPYKIGTIDKEFGISQSEVSRAAQDAVRVWEEASERDLFVEITDGTPVITIHFRYDLRQQTTEQLKDLGSQISKTSAKYEDVEKNYDATRTVFLQRRTAFEAEANALESAAAAYKTEVDSWNKKGGAPPDIVRRLSAEKASIQARQATLSENQRSVNVLADEVNALARQLNTMAGDINATARTYNKVGAQTGEEFEEGVFESRAGEESITVFEFDSYGRMSRLLAHEFGHALGLDHVENKQSIMYRLNEGTKMEATSEDMETLIEQCRL